MESEIDKLKTNKVIMMKKIKEENENRAKLQKNAAKEIPGYCKVLWDREYKDATWIVMAIAFVNQFTGINLIGIYSTSIIE